MYSADEVISTMTKKGCMCGVCLVILDKGLFGVGGSLGLIVHTRILNQKIFESRRCMCITLTVPPSPKKKLCKPLDNSHSFVSTHLNLNVCNKSSEGIVLSEAQCQCCAMSGTALHPPTVGPAAHSCSTIGGLCVSASGASKRSDQSSGIAMSIQSMGLCCTD